MYKILIIGFGSIGTEVAKALIIGVENFSLYGVVSRSKENVERRILQLNHQIKIFDSKFTPRGVIGDGKSSRKRGNLKGPEGIEVWNDNIWVSDTHNSRIQLFRRTDISTN